MSDLTDTPGIYLMPKKNGAYKKSNSFGPYVAFAKGHLASRTQHGKWTILMDGLFTDNPKKDKTDAQFALDLFLSSGLDKINQLNGFFNILIIDESGEEIHLVSDLLCSRPWYLYQKNDISAVAPSPVAFNKFDLQMSINRQALYEQIRLLHTGYDRTLVQEVKRILPGHGYKIGLHGLKAKNKLHQFHQNVNQSLTLDDSASWLTQICRDTINGVLNHPKLENLPVQLPLTGGLDSRHLLGELMEQNRKPDTLSHIRIQKKDYKPVRKMAEELEIPLRAHELEELDTIDLTQRWAQRSGGLVNFHQHYLLHLKSHSFDNAAISFNGYLMDWFLGMATKTKNLSPKEPFRPIWNRTYSSPSIRKMLIPDERHWAKSIKKLFIEEIKSYKGEPWFRLMMLDLHHRGLHYTGIVDTMLADDVFSFSPGASPESYRFLATAPHNIAGDKKARLQALKKYFSQIASFPSSEGVPFSTMDKRKEIVKNPITKNAKLFFKALLSGFQKDIAPESEHSWIRNHQTLHRLHKNMISTSELAQDGYLNKFGLKTCWTINQLGGYQGWTLMSLLSAEVAYQVLVKKRAPQDVIENLNKNI